MAEETLGLLPPTQLFTAEPAGPSLLDTIMMLVVVMVMVMMMSMVMPMVTGGEKPKEVEKK